MKDLTCDLIVADKPTINGRIYSEECLRGFVEQCNRDPQRMFLTAGFDEGSSARLSSVIGRARNFALSVSGTISAQIELLPNSPITEAPLGQFDFSPMVVGTVDPDGSVRDGIVAYWALTPRKER